MKASVVVDGGAKILDEGGQSNGGSVSYQLVYEGNNGHNPLPARFQTAMKPQHFVFDARVQSLDACKELCSKNVGCLGIFYYHSGRCKGLNFLGSSSVPTKINADSYVKVT